MTFSNPLNVLLIPPILYLVFRLIVPHPLKQTPAASTYSEENYNWLPAKHPEVICQRKYTAKELLEYDGTKASPRILLAILRVGNDGKWGERTVFDVTAGKSFYGPDGVYGNFAGRDASRGMAKQSFEPEMLTAVDQPLDNLADLTKAEIDNMRGWHEHFERKYIVCGELVEG
ncbi:hypothetical protein I302_104478 [Kwoniella bestiolae CBS 10118]|uniref:Cytochrome b5 heme-binding domain-containing protein n=1 Tax=Kwoniella bestiolae CBS 10118 TaxID=1296100 RepID=A0A1B9GBD3_9TREE|nr:hypothetical protein I302_03182 [Kwoniella bestiolae CBS 10118]OCF28325.1 hypothetical protein I302_03182 [Kwoniella bestiolae CBS 10118]